MTARSALASAIGTCPGINAHEYVVGDTSPGTAYPRLDEINYPNRIGGVISWQVVVVLPQDLAEAERWLDTRTDAWVAALSDEMTITSLRPQRLQLDGVGTLPVAFINGRREADNPTLEV